MDTSAALDVAVAEFRRRLHDVPADAWHAPTPCDGWDVRQLVGHVVAGNRMSVVLLAGGTAADAMAAIAGVGAGDDPEESFEASVEAQRAAFDEPGALERTCHHPMGDIPGERLRGFRIVDLTLHAWDLARATGGDEHLDPSLVAGVWEAMSPMASVIGRIGVFGSGPSQALGDDAPLQRRLLDLAGRRP